MKNKNKGKKIDYNIVIPLIILLVSILSASSYYLISNLINDKKENDEFKNLEQMIIVENANDKNEEIREEKSETTNYTNLDLNSLKMENNDLKGWIKIEDSNINYPVMQNGNYYLRRNFYKNKSKLVTPYLADYCNIKTSEF